MKKKISGIISEVLEPPDQIQLKKEAGAIDIPNISPFATLQERIDHRFKVRQIEELYYQNKFIRKNDQGDDDGAQAVFSYFLDTLTGMYWGFSAMKSLNSTEGSSFTDHYKFQIARFFNTHLRFNELYHQPFELRWSLNPMLLYVTID